MKKIKGEFLTEKEAAAAFEKINPYCGNSKITFNDNFTPDYGSNGYVTGENCESFYGYPETGGFDFGGFADFGITSVSGFNPYGPYCGYKRPFMHFYNPSQRAAVEADVADENYEYVKDRLYSFGAISVVPRT